MSARSMCSVPYCTEFATQECPCCGTGFCKTHAQMKVQEIKDEAVLRG